MQTPPSLVVAPEEPKAPQRDVILVNIEGGDDDLPLVRPPVPVEALVERTDAALAAEQPTGAAPAAGEDMLMEETVAPGTAPAAEQVTPMEVEPTVAAPAAEEVVPMEVASLDTALPVEGPQSPKSSRFPKDIPDQTRPGSSGDLRDSEIDDPTQEQMFRAGNQVQSRTWYSTEEHSHPWDTVIKLDYES